MQGNHETHLDSYQNGSLELAGLKQILSEPIVKDGCEQLLRADWAARGFLEISKTSII